MYFNKRHDRVGPLFQGRFKAEHVSRDEYLKYLFSYIHLNPVKLIAPNWKEKGIERTDTVKKYLREYAYSSYSDFTEIKRAESAILSREEFPKYFSSSVEFDDFIDEWLRYKEENILPLN